MSTKKDLVEAHGFSRRRLVTAFVSGAPGGREVEPSRPGRTIVGGVALGVLVLAGGAIAGVFSGRPPEGWLDPGLVASGGSLYAITEESADPELRPIDPISARLIFGSDAEASEVSTDAVAQQRTGAQIGILGAPSALPADDLLVDRGWTSCTVDGGGTRTVVADAPPASPAPGSGLVVRVGRGTWLLAFGEVAGDPAAQAFRYRLPGPATSAILGELGLAVATDAIAEVDREWLNLWPEGAQLRKTSFDTGPDTGSTAAPVGQDWFEGLDETPRAGDTVDVNGLSYLVTPGGPAPLSEFASAVHRAVGDGEARTAERLASGVETVGGVPDGWPTTTPAEVDDGSMCAMLLPRTDERPTIVIADDHTEQEELQELAPASDVSVQEGRGAFVLVGTDADRTSLPYVVDARGLSHLLEGQDAIDMLGYGSHAARLVPDAWLELFGCGVVLSRDAALRAPEPDGAVPDHDRC